MGDAETSGGDETGGDETGGSDAGDTSGDPDLAGMNVVFERDHLNAEDYEEPLFDTRQIVAIDISNPDQLGEALILADSTPNEYLGITGQTPFGSLLVRRSNAEGTTVSLLNLDPASGFELGPFVPDGLPTYAELSQAWTTDGGAESLIFAKSDDDKWGLYWVAFAGKQPSKSVQIHPDAFSFTAISPDRRHAAFSRTSEQEQITYVYLVELTPEPVAPVLVGSLTPPKAALRVFLSDTVLAYDFDLDDDGILDIITFDVNDPLSPPKSVSSKLNADQESGKVLARRWSSTGELVYWTGTGDYGDLYLVEFDGAKAKDPVQLNGADMQSKRSGFNFERGGGVFFAFGTTDDGIQGIAHVAIKDGTPAAPVVASEALAPGSQISAVKDDITNRFERGEVHHVLYQVAGDHPTRVEHIEFTADGPTPENTLFDGFDAEDTEMSVVPPIDHWMVGTGMVDGKLRLFSVDVDNPAATTWLDTALPDNWTSKRFLLSPDEQQLVVEAETPTGAALLRTPIDGSRPLELLDEGDGYSTIAFVKP